MAGLLSDTAPHIAHLLVQAWRETPPWRKLQMVDELNTTLHQLALSDLQRRYPDTPLEHLRQRLALRWTDPTLVARLVPAPVTSHATD